MHKRLLSRSVALMFQAYHSPDHREGGNKRYFRLSVRLSVCPSVMYVANNLRTQRPSVPKFGRKVPHLRCDVHTSSNGQRSGLEAGGSILCRPNATVTLLVTFYVISTISSISRQFSVISSFCSSLKIRAWPQVFLSIMVEQCRITFLKIHDAHLNS